ncbi:DUF1573 domain-containing protein [Phnomibacter sp. MR]|uniref:DUF1573 domain-containing protein n=1 Tax=Phnomibacter sp. MR TaxID=3042318 RepID=UPI003A80D7E3
MKFVYLFAALLGFTACISDEESKAAAQGGTDSATVLNDSANYTTVQWSDSIQNLGTVREGEKLEVVFKMKNTGTKPLVVQSVAASCGCTVPSKPEEPVMPGAEAAIKAVFDSQGRSGTNHKTITVVTNTIGNQNHVLEFNVEVIGSKEGPKATNIQPVKTGI